MSVWLPDLAPAEKPLHVAVVGSGPAGMMAAGVAASRGHRVTLFEPQAVLGRKLRITGKGRCNLTNHCDVSECVGQFRRNPKFLLSALNRFAPADTERFFESLGVPLKTERGGRVFPQSDSAHDVAEALRGWLIKSGVEMQRARVSELVTGEGQITGVICEGDSTRRFHYDRVILATGGVSYPKTGSTGDGYALAGRCGHTVVPPVPSLVPLVSPDGYCLEMQGLSLRNVQLTMEQGGKRVFSQFGEMLFTHFGVSGPLVLSASAFYQPKAGETTLSIDLKPALDEKTLDMRILRDFDKYRNRDITNALGDLLHKKIIPVIIALLGLPPETKVHSVTAAQRRALLQVIKAFPVHVTGTRPIEEAIVTSGGVSTREIDPATMASKRLSGLYFAGELIDVDAFTGGYNLQIAWSTGFCAGCGV